MFGWVTFDGHPNVLEGPVKVIIYYDIRHIYKTFSPKIKV